MQDDGPHAEIVQKMRAAGARAPDERLDIIEGDGGFPPSVLAPVYLAVSAILYGAAFKGMKLGVPLPFKLPEKIDKKVSPWLSAHPPTPTGGAADAVLAALAQGAALCLAALALPLATILWRRARDVAGGSMYISFWGTTLCGPLAFVMVKDLLWPLIRDMTGWG